MGQNKFEKEIGKNLRSREIAPRETSWDKLSSRLEKEDRKSYSLHWFTGVAASLIAGFFIIGQVYQTNNIDNTPAVVETPVEINNEENNTKKEHDFQVAVEETHNPVVKEKMDLKKPAKNAPVPKKEEITSIVHEVANNPQVYAEEAAIAEITKEETENILHGDLEEVIAAVSSNLANKDDLAEAEVDSLLMMAASRISRERTVYLAGENINAESLLWDVEMEMEQSFREKVFDIMKEGYLKARTAVANRNY